jgi:hypothetical protein
MSAGGCSVGVVIDLDARVDSYAGNSAASVRCMPQHQYSGRALETGRR